MATPTGLNLLFTSLLSMVCIYENVAIFLKYNVSNFYRTAYWASKHCYQKIKDITTSANDGGEEKMRLP